MPRGRSRSSRRRRARRLWLTVTGVVLGAALAWSALSLWQVGSDLREAREAGEAMADALDAGDRDTLLLRAGDLAESASAAADGSDGWWWSVMGAAPVLGDDVRAVRAVSASLDEAAGGALVPLLTALVGVDHVAVDGRLDLDRTRRCGCCPRCSAATSRSGSCWCSRATRRSVARVACRARGA